MKRNQDQKVNELNNQIENLNKIQQEKENNFDNVIKQKKEKIVQLKRQLVQYEGEYSKFRKEKEKKIAQLKEKLEKSEHDLQELNQKNNVLSCEKWNLDILNENLENLNKSLENEKQKNIQTICDLTNKYTVVEKRTKSVCNLQPLPEKKIKLKEFDLSKLLSKKDNEISEYSQDYALSYIEEFQKSMSQQFTLIFENRQQKTTDKNDDDREIKQKEEKIQKYKSLMEKMSSQIKNLEQQLTDRENYSDHTNNNKDATKFTKLAEDTQKLTNSLRLYIQSFLKVFLEFAEKVKEQEQIEGWTIPNFEEILTRFTDKNETDKVAIIQEIVRNYLSVKTSE
ncbi:hypothetical protein TRFO_40830 [Tritrichomonas foetus]|nr:hypothetical protein TRFO_40830 [Tritrichomonas foetus]|eukprot:OHS92835.1 hypothetical protein TRFO_40830 [Tritrichomonas foetus]